MENIADSLGSLIGNLVNTVDPGFIVLGGGVVLNNIEFRKMLITGNFPKEHKCLKNCDQVKLLNKIFF